MNEPQAPTIVDWAPMPYHAHHDGLSSLKPQAKTNPSSMYNMYVLDLDYMYNRDAAGILLKKSIIPPASGIKFDAWEKA